MKTIAQIIAEVKAIQLKWTGKDMPKEDAEQIQALLAEGKSLQDRQVAEKALEDLEAKGLELAGTPLLPEEKGKELNDNENAGYMKLGRSVTSSDEFKSYVKTGFSAAAQGARIQVKLANGFVPISKKEFDAFAKKEGKAITFGAGFVNPERYEGEIARTVGRDRLSLRDLVRVVPTMSDAIEYYVMTSAPSSSATVAEGGNKPESTMALEVATASVRVIATWLPISLQKLSDIPAIESLIDDNLLYDLKKVEERQMLWGPGTGSSLLGIFNVPAVLDSYDDTGNLIDRIRKARSTVVAAGADPDTVLIHPFDMDSIVLAKGTDGHYLYFLGADGEGNERIHGLRVVESVACQNPATPTERRVLVGDFKRGATLYDREQATVTVGWVNAQFTQNMRTILAEERVAFAVERPYCFCAIVATDEA